VNAESTRSQTDTGDVVERAMDRVAGTRPIPGNRVTLLFDGPEVYPAMLDCIAGAQRWIHLDNYIIRSDATGRRFADALIERARAGIAVRVLTDWMGSVSTRGSYWRRLRDAGISVRKFNPPHPLRLRLNLTRTTGGLVVDGTRRSPADSASAMSGPDAARDGGPGGTPRHDRRPAAAAWIAPSTACGSGRARPRGTSFWPSPREGSRCGGGRGAGRRASRAPSCFSPGLERIWITDA
jgi:hypothetical protein